MGWRVIEGGAAFDLDFKMSRSPGKGVGRQREQQMQRPGGRKRLECWRKRKASVAGKE